MSLRCPTDIIRLHFIWSNVIKAIKTLRFRINIVYLFIYFSILIMLHVLCNLAEDGGKDKKKIINKQWICIMLTFFRKCIRTIQIETSLMFFFRSTKFFGVIVMPNKWVACRMHMSNGWVWLWAIWWVLNYISAWKIHSSYLRMYAWPWNIIVYAYNLWYCD